MFRQKYIYIFYVTEFFFYNGFIIIVIIIIFCLLLDSYMLYKLKIFSREAKPLKSLLFNPLSHNASQSMIKLNINKKYVAMVANISHDFANKLFIIKKMFLISIYKSVQNS